MAGTKTTTCPIAQNVKTFGLTFVNSDSFIAANGGTSPTNTKLLYTAGSNDDVIKTIMVASDDSSARQVSFYWSPDSGTTKYLLTTVNVPIGSGLTSGTTANVDCFTSAAWVGLPTDQSGRPVMPLLAGDRIYAGLITAAATSGRTIHIVGISEQY